MKHRIILITLILASICWAQASQARKDQKYLVDNIDTYILRIDLLMKTQENFDSLYSDIRKELTLFMNDLNVIKRASLVQQDGIWQYLYIDDKFFFRSNNLSVLLSRLKKLKKKLTELNNVYKIRTGK